MMDAKVKQLHNRDKISPKPRSPWSIISRKKGLCKTIDGGLYERRAGHASVEFVLHLRHVHLI